MTASNDVVERIAEVLREHRTVYHGSAACRCGKFSAGSSDFDGYNAHVAAAVVAELQLTEETRADGVRSGGITHFPRVVARRWVTGWEKAE